jgi:transcription elongation factor Elf1
MVSEFDLPCTACGHALSETTLAVPGEEGVAVAECPACGTRHYPESALDSAQNVPVALAGLDTVDARES